MLVFEPLRKKSELYLKFIYPIWLKITSWIRLSNFRGRVTSFWPLKLQKRPIFEKKTRCHRYSTPHNIKSITNRTTIFPALISLMLYLFLLLTCLKALKCANEAVCSKHHNVCYRYGRPMFDTSKKMSWHVCLNEWNMTPLTSVIYTNHVDYNIKSDFQGQFSN